MNLKYLKLAALVVCLLGSALLFSIAGGIPKASGWFALAAVLPVLVPLPALVVVSRPGQAWICLILSAVAAVASCYQYAQVIRVPDPFVLMAIWAYPIVNSGVVLVLLLLGLVLATNFQFRRDEV